MDGLLIDYLSKPGRIEKLLARDDSTYTAALRTELASIDAKKGDLATAFANDDVDVGQLATATRVLDQRSKAITQQLAAVGWRSPLEPLAHGSIHKLWFGDDETEGPVVGSEARDPQDRRGDHCPADGPPSSWRADGA